MISSMILVFGGTTEGRKAAEVLEEAGASYFYSTKTGEQDLVLHHGRRIDGALDADAMQDFCVHHGVRLIVDATHPFAQRLHETIATVTVRLQIPVIRYERIYPERASELTWIDDYSELPALLKPSSTLLATTGVQSISKLKPLEDLGFKVYYRILPRESSVALAKAQGATTDQLCYYESSSQIDTNADAILLKESGLSGGFIEKVNVAKEHGMRIIVLKRPAYPHAEAYSVNGPYGLRRAVEKLLPEFFPLHSGLTTGTCATAAAMAATMQSFGQQSESQSVLPSEVPVRLPNGETISVTVGYGDNYAYCIKEAGDDPDVTNGIEVRATVAQEHGKDADITIKGGEGVGTFTLPGFDYPPGSPAINKAPREMIRENLRPLRQAQSAVPDALTITISVPHGAEIAQRTFNPRLGIEGGISIIGVSGIVKPFSEEAFIESIRKCMTVAKASGSERVVINSGGKSERFVKERYPDLPQQAFVEYGNYIGETLKMARELEIPKITLGVMLGKAVKLAQGHLDTHSRRATMDKNFVGQLLSESGITLDISTFTLARELWEHIPEERQATFAQTVIAHCYEHCKPLIPNNELTIFLINDNGKIYETV